MIVEENKISEWSKTILSFILGIALTVFWLQDDGEEEDNGEFIYIEFECSNLEVYDKVPQQVVDECNRKFRKK